MITIKNVQVYQVDQASRKPEVKSSHVNFTIAFGGNDYFVKMTRVDPYDEFHAYLDGDVMAWGEAPIKARPSAILLAFRVLVWFRRHYDYPVKLVCPRCKQSKRFNVCLEQTIERRENRNGAGITTSIFVEDTEDETFYCPDCDYSGEEYEFEEAAAEWRELQ